MSRTRKDHPVLRQARQRALAEKPAAEANRRTAPARRTVNVALSALRYGTGPTIRYAAEVA